MLHVADMCQTPDCVIGEQHCARGTQTSFLILLLQIIPVCFSHAVQRRALNQMTNTMKNETNSYP